MREADIDTALTMWEDQGAEGLPRAEIARVLRRLPESGICAVTDDVAELLMLGPTDTLFTVSIDGEAVAVTSRPLDANRLVVELQLEDDRSRWTFRHAGGAEPLERWQRISGTVTIDPDTGGEQLDDREQFARVLAERAGWTRTARGPSAGEPPASSSPEEPTQEPPQEPPQEEPRWRARTDVWGRPLDVRHR